MVGIGRDEVRRALTSPIMQGGSDSRIRSPSFDDSRHCLESKIDSHLVECVDLFRELPKLCLELFHSLGLVVERTSQTPLIRLQRSNAPEISENPGDPNTEDPMA